MISKICNALIWLILAVVVTVAGVLLVPRLFGMQVFGVLSGSMEPAFHVGSIVFVKPAVPADIAVGDAITFTMPQDKNLVATHRVIAVHEDSFSTKGDANEVADMEPIPFDRLVGKAVYTVPLLGYLAFYLQTKQGILAGIALLLFVILLSSLSALTDRTHKGPAPAQDAQSAADPQNDNYSEEEEKHET